MSYWDGNQIVRRPDRLVEGSPGWIMQDCGCCDGLEWGGEVPTECTLCNGGFVFKHLASGVLAMYPSGPFLGREPSER